MIRRKKSFHSIRYHEDKMVNFDLQDGYSVLTLPKPSSSPQLNQDDEEENIIERVKPTIDSFNIIQTNSHSPPAISVLLVHEVQFKHAGNYTCAPSNTRPTHINIHVLKGK